jgi:hypothetical protein
MYKIFLVLAVATGLAVFATHNQNVNLTPEQQNKLFVAQDKLNSAVVGAGSEKQVEAAKKYLLDTENAVGLERNRK